MKISIAMCTYNGGKYITEQLLSFVNQSLLPTELVVCDDGSQDDTVALVEGFRSTAPFTVHLYQNEQNLGYYRNFERAASLCGGDIIAFSDQDDVWYPSKLEQVVAKFTDRHVGFVFSNADIVDRNLKPLGYTLFEHAGIPTHLFKRIEQGQSRHIIVKSGFMIFGMTLVFRRQALEQVLPFPENTPHDAWIPLVLSFTSEFAVVLEPLVMYRQHRSNMVGASVLSMNERMSKTVFQDARNSRRKRFHKRMTNYQALKARLETIGSFHDSVAAYKLLDDVIAYYHRRSTLDSRRLYRIGGALRELIEGNYHRFSTRGFREFAKELLERDKTAKQGLE